MEESTVKYCPMSGRECQTNCAWLRGNECAVALLAHEAYAALEAYMVVNRLHDKGSEGGAQPGASLTQNNKEVNG